MIQDFSALTLDRIDLSDHYYLVDESCGKSVTSLYVKHDLERVSRLVSFVITQLMKMKTQSLFPLLMLFLLFP